jgi:hypothetical protein
MFLEKLVVAQLVTEIPCLLWDLRINESLGPKNTPPHSILS